MLTTDNHNLRFTHFLWSSTHMTHFNSLFLTLVVLITFFLPTSARAEQWESLKAGPFACGQSDTYDNGAVTAASAAAASANDWDTCINTYIIPSNPDEPACFVQPKGTTTQSCDYKRTHDPLEEGLALARATAVLNIFRGLRPEAGRSDSIAPTITLVDTRVKMGYLVILPKAGAVRKDSIRPACSDGADNDEDGLIDMDDPGCTDPSDNDEFNQVKPDQKWAGLTQVLLREADNLCPTYIVATWDARGGMTYSLQDNTCTCSNFDAKPSTAAFEVTSDISVARKLAADHREWEAETKDLTYTMVREYLEEGTWANVTELDETGEATTTTPDDGMGVVFLESGDTLRVRFPNRCDDNLQAEHNGDYTGVDFILAANGTLGSQAVGMGNHVKSGPFGMSTLEAGLEAGGPNGAFFGTVGVGGWFDDNCASTAAWLGTVRLGATIGRSKPIGGIITVRGIVSYGPSVSIEITPDDPDTTTNEYSETEVPAWGLNTIGGFVEGGPRFAFGNGVHNGWIAPMASVGPVQRWVYQPDGSLGTTVTADIAISVFGGFAF